ncbi:hypothetical protein [Bradyrhizobium arachidis]|uniref:hypothetical protein n=1 Tax=Bradyrhizobium arachidis TaxID=858423 RepID=UPI002163906B|nr:hypothetical protein [Bradyrhizobium arachidis]UVO28578.1 hypothetical protein KUF59_40070 [Bradyrhizobium arachidis]
MLLTLLSDTTIDASRLESFIVGKSVGTLPLWKVGASPAPGCLTSEDEERETWTAESLRVSLIGSFGFRDRDRTKDFGGTRFKGYTIVASDVNRRQLVDFGRRKMVGPRQTL